MAISDWPESQRPREKLLSQGPQSLTDAELLAIFLRTGIPGCDAIQLATLLINNFGSLRQMLNADQTAFCQHKGLGIAKFVQLQASVEMSRRYLAESLQQGEQLNSPVDTHQYLIAELRDEPHEVFGLLLLDNKHRVLKFSRLFYGTIDGASVYPRVVVKTVLENNAAAVILTHNHPSGVAEPSLADKQITQRIVEALKLIDVRVLDHVIVGDNETVSFAQRGLI
jgi:DNA repair protein RadC